MSASVYVCTDLNYLDIVDPNAIVVESSFFLGTGTRIWGVGGKVVNPHQTTIHSGSGKVNGLYLQFNIGMGLQLVGNFSQTSNCLIAHQGGLATVASKSLTQANNAAFEFDFGSALVFDTIESVQYEWQLSYDLASIQLQHSC